MFKDFQKRLEGKRYQELSRPYRIVLWLRWMPCGYVKGLGWYFIKRLRWENLCDDDYGRVSLGTCLGICVGTVQSEMNWYFRPDEIFGDGGAYIYKSDGDGFLEKLFDFLGEKLIDIIDGKSIYD